MICTTRSFTGLALLLCVINVANGRHIATVRTEQFTMDITPISRIQGKDNDGKMHNIFHSITTAEPSPPETQSLQHNDRVLPVLQRNETRLKEHSIEDNKLTRGKAQHKNGPVPKCNQRIEGASTLAPEGSLTTPILVNSHRRKKRGNVNNLPKNLSIKIKLGVHVNINNQMQSEYTLCENNSHVSKSDTTDNSSKEYISIGSASRARAKLDVESSTPKPVENTEPVLTTLNTTETTSPGYVDTTLPEASTKEPTTQWPVNTTLISTTQETTPTTYLPTVTSTLVGTTTHISKRSTEDTEIDDFNTSDLSFGKKAPRSGKGTGDNKKHLFLPKAEGPTTENMTVNETGKGGNLKSLFGCFNGTSGSGTESGKPNICQEEIVEETIKDKSVVYVDEFTNGFKSSNQASGSERRTEESKLRNVGPTTKVYGSEGDYATFIAPRAKENALIERCYILPCIDDTSKCDEMCKMLHKFKALMCC